MTLSVGAVALICLVLLILFGNGRLRVICVALCAAVVGGVLAQVGAQLIKGAGALLTALTSAFT